MVADVKRRTALAIGALVVGVFLAGCGSGSSSPTTSSTPSTTATPSSTATSAPTTTTTAASTTGTATCPPLSQAEAALGGSFSGPVQTATRGGGIVCEYTAGAGGNAAVAIFAHQSAAVFAGQVSNAPGAPAMPAISGVGDGAFGQTTGGRSIVNAYSNGSRTVVAAQGPGSLTSVEALARVALADN